MEKLKGYRTMIFNGIMAVLVVFKYIYPDAELPDAAVIGSLLDGIIANIEAITVVGNVILRAFTTTPVFKKEPQE